MQDRRSLLRALFALPVGLSTPQLLPGVARAALPAPSGDVTEDEAFWARLRWQFHIPPDEAYFNTGSAGAQPRVVTDAVIGHLLHTQAHLARWNFSHDVPPAYAGYRPMVPLRQKLAAFVGCDADELALTHNSTMGTNFIASGLELDAGDEVLITDREHPGGESAWRLLEKRRGIKVTEVTLPLDSPESIVAAFEAAIGRKTRVLAVPHVVSGLGVVLPVKALCDLARRRGLFTAIDGAQGPGQLSVDLHDLGCDAYASSPHKWMLAPTGSGFLYVRRDALEQLWTTLASRQWDNHSDGAWRLMHYGTRSPSQLAGLEAAVDFLSVLGADRIAQRSRYLADRLRAGLAEIDGVTIRSPTHPALAGAMVTWHTERLRGHDLQEALWKETKVRVRAVGGENIRQSCHLYNSLAEVERTLEAARRIQAG